MKDKIISVIARHGELEQLMTEQAVLSNSDKLKEVAREHRHLSPIVLEGDKYLALIEQINDDLEILKGSDEELKSIAQAELKTLQENKKDSEEALKVMLIPKDPNDDKNTIIEIRAGTGGDEAGLFVADLYRMYERFSERNQWTKEAIGISETGIGGFKEIIFSVKGESVYGMMKFESGVHRVQRVPKTETSGRVHTSAATVAVLPEAEAADIQVVDAEIKIDTYRASGAGGQHVNKTESAVRITHLPTSTVVQCQDGRSQHKNKAQAMSVLIARIRDKQMSEQQAKQAATRKLLIGSGDRSERIRTYNFPQGRISDHRINLTLYKIDQIMDGDLNELCSTLASEHQAEQLAAMGE